MFQRHPVQNDETMLITTVTQNRSRVFADPTHAREAIASLYRVKDRCPFQLFGFVIMPDHCHFLMHVPSPERISRIMCTYKYGLTFNLGIGKFWQSRFHIVIPKDSHNALRYIHLNPVRAGLVSVPEDHPWSSASGKWFVDDLGW
jgi:putative transposase